MGQFGLQDANSPIIEELIFLHDFINLILIFIISFVLIIIIYILLNNYININLLERQIIECIWTIIPAIILIQIEFDSYIIPQNELETNIFRLLDVDNRTIIPYNIHIRILISSADVLHA